MPMTPPERAQIASRAPERASRPRFSIGTLVALGVFGVVTVNLYLPEAAATDLPEWTQAAAAAESSAPVAGGPETRGLLDAVEAQHPESVAALLAAGSDPGETNRFGESALHLAAPGDHAILAALIDAGADPNGRDADGVTPLMLAATAGRADNVASLRDAGARLDMKDYQGSSPGDWARRGGHNAIARRLDSALAASAAPSRRTSSGINFAEDVFVGVKFPEWFKTSFLDLRNDLDEALNAGKQGIMLFVSAARCSYCKAYMVRPAMQEEIAVWLKEKLRSYIRHRGEVPSTALVP
jgi:hypothetical protein